MTLPSCMKEGSFQREGDSSVSLSQRMHGWECACVCARARARERLTCPLGFIFMTSSDLCSILWKESIFLLQAFSPFSSIAIITLQQGGEPSPHRKFVSLAMVFCSNSWIRTRVCKCRVDSCKASETSYITGPDPLRLLVEFSPNPFFFLVQSHPRLWLERDGSRPVSRWLGSFGKNNRV